MAQTITQKILASAVGRDQVSPGEILQVPLDAVIGHDTSVAVFRTLKKWGIDQVFDPDKICITADHFIPSPTADAAIQYKTLQDFMQEYHIRNWFPWGQGGICHALFPERGLVRPGMIIVGSDSHTCTYGALGAFSCGMGATDAAGAMALGETWLKVPESILLRYSGKLPERVSGKDLILCALGLLGVEGALYRTLEFAGDTIHALDMDGRFTMCNMAVEAGAKNGIIAPDEVTEAYVRERSTVPYKVFAGDPDAEYASVHDIDVSSLTPLVAAPCSPGNVVPVSDLHGIRVDQVVIGSCTNGRIQDLRDAASLIRGHRFAAGVRVIVIPASQHIYMQAMKEGLIETFLEAGALIAPSTCGPCFGGHMGLLAPGEVCVSTTNRNFVSRMGHRESQVYLSSPFTAAASAIAGEITDPRNI